MLEAIVPSANVIMEQGRMGADSLNDLIIGICLHTVTEIDSSLGIPSS